MHPIVFPDRWLHVMKEIIWDKKQRRAGTWKSGNYKQLQFCWGGISTEHTSQCTRWDSKQHDCRDRAERGRKRRIRSWARVWIRVQTGGRGKRGRVRAGVQTRGRGKRGRVRAGVRTGRRTGKNASKRSSDSGDHSVDRCTAGRIGWKLWYDSRTLRWDPENLRRDWLYAGRRSGKNHQSSEIDGSDGVDKSADRNCMEWNLRKQCKMEPRLRW